MDIFQSHDNNNLMWNNLPNELLTHIFQYLPQTDLQQIRLVCKRWRDVTYLRKFLNKFKLVIGSHNLISVCEMLTNDKDFSKTMAYETLELKELELSDDLHQVLKFLGTNIRCLSISNSEPLPILNDCLPNLEELIISTFVSLKEYHISDFDLRKFKHLKSLGMMQGFEFYLLKNLLDEPPFKMEKLCLNLNDTEELIIQTLQYHGSSLKHLEIFLSCSSELKLFSQWKQVFSLFIKLETLRLTGDCCYRWLKNIMEGLPKETSLRNLDLSGGLQVDDYLLKLIIEKWSGSLEDINLCFCVNITGEGVQHLGKLQRNLKVLNVSFCRNVTAEKLIKSFAAEKYTTLKTLILSDMPGNEPIDVLIKRLPEVTVLDLGNCENVDNFTLKSINQYQRKVQILYLNDCKKISDNGLVGFSSTAAPLSNLKGLLSLDLRGCYKISDRALIEVFKFHELRELLLGYCHRITSQGIKELVKNCPALENFTISSCSMIDDNAMLFIVRDLKRLKYLNVSNCTQITGKSLDYVAEYCKCLKIIEMHGIDSLQDPELKEKFQKLRELNIIVET